MKDKQGNDVDLSNVARDIGKTSSDGMIVVVMVVTDDGRLHVGWAGLAKEPPGPIVIRVFEIALQTAREKYGQ